MVQVGTRYGKLTVVTIGAPDRSRHRTCTCICDCGKPATARTTDLLRGHTTSCGCALIARKTKHGQVNSRTYQSWRAMRKRCNDTKNVQYPNYGGRGIKVCAEWDDSETGYVAFVRDMGERPPGMTLDRRDVNGDYCVSNCKWATSTQQQWNKRSTRELREDAEESAYWQQQEEDYFASNSSEN